jgi:hypothetical protein
LRLENTRFHGQVPFTGHQAKIALLVLGAPGSSPGQAVVSDA